MNKIFIFLILFFSIFASGCTSIAIPTDQAQSFGSNNLILELGMNNNISNLTFDKNFTEICFKNSSTYIDIGNAGDSTIGGNCNVGDRGLIILLKN